MAQEQSTPPGQDRPWYYQNWFLIATFIFGWPIGPPLGVLWPVFAVLILRSPWHSQLLVKGLGWAMLVVGAIMFARALTGDEGTAGIAVATLIPGLLVTMITQFMWNKYKLEHRIGRKTPALPAIPTIESDPPSRRSGPRRRTQRKRGSRPGRSSRRS